MSDEKRCTKFENIFRNCRTKIKYNLNSNSLDYTKLSWHHLHLMKTLRQVVSRDSPPCKRLLYFREGEVSHGEPDTIGAGDLECQVATATFRSPAKDYFRGRSSGRGNIQRITRRSDRSHGEPDAIGAGDLECQVATAAFRSPSRFKGFGRNCVLTLICLLGARTRICFRGARQSRASVL